jgi:hypothetical protein
MKPKYVVQAPCPFCKHVPGEGKSWSPVYDEIDQSAVHQRLYRVVCDNKGCGACGPMRYSSWMAILAWNAKPWFFGSKKD